MQEQEGWNEHSKLVLNELKRLNEKLESLETQIEDRMERAMLSIKAEHKSLETQVTQLKIDLAVLQKEVAIKSVIVAFSASLIFSILNIIIK